MPDPYRSGIRWAAGRARRHVKGFVLGGLIFSIAAASISSIVNEPPHPTALDHFVNAGVGALAALVVVGTLAFVYALVVAPYEQRNRLRQDLNESRAEVGRLKDTKIDVRFGVPESRRNRVLLLLTNQGKPASFTVQASNIRGEGLSHFDPFPVSWEGSGSDDLHLREGDSHRLVICSFMATRLGKSTQTFDVSFATPTSSRKIKPSGNVSVDLEVRDLDTGETQRSQVTLAFSEERTGWLEFEGASCTGLA